MLGQQSRDIVTTFRRRYMECGPAFVILCFYICTMLMQLPRDLHLPPTRGTVQRGQVLIIPCVHVYTVAKQ